MKQLAFVIALILTQTVFAQEVCYQITANKDFWSRTPEMLCVMGDVQDDKYTITLKTGLSMYEQVFATFNVNLLQRIRCADCNKDLFGLANPSNSAFNELSIRFDGTRNLTARSEQGLVFVGANKFFYRSLNQAKIKAIEAKATLRAILLQWQVGSIEHALC